MITNVIGRVDNIRLKPYQALKAIFEAVSNSLHAIEDSSKTANGKILIEILRKQGNQAVIDDSIAPINAIKIIDNGIGFTEENFESFNEAETHYKKNRGGKGIGRFLWLKSFKRARIESIYDEESQWKRRTFDFCYTHDGVENAELHDLQDAQVERTTTVTLEFPRDDYIQHLPKSATALATRIADHFIRNLFSPSCPSLRVKDDQEAISINDVFRDMYCESGVEDVHIETADFEITHVLYYGHAGCHQVHFLAHGVSVTIEDLKELLPGAPREKLVDEDRAFYYIGLVSGAYLDEMVNETRTGFDIPSEKDGSLGSEITENLLHKKIKETIENFLGEYFRPARETRNLRIEELAQSNPMNRVLLNNYPEKINEIPTDITSPKALDAFLRKIEFEVKDDLRERAEQFQRLPPEEIERKRSEYLRFIEEENAHGKAALGNYVIHRKVILELFQKFLKKDSDGRYRYEALLHDIIAPMRVTSEDPAFSRHNLWLVDERLEYHSYLASDMLLKSLEPLNSNEATRPDTIVFNRPMIFSDQHPYSSVIILEFKRPGRDDYTRSKNPVDEIEDRIYKIRRGELEFDGRTFRVPEQMPFFGYVICDLERSLREVADRKNWHDLPDGQGYYTYHGKLKAWTEVISYDKLVEDAKKRNRVFFEKLNIPTL